MKIALVTGSRDWADGSAIRSALSAFSPDLLIHGDCPRGADRIADEWAAESARRHVGLVGVLRFPAEYSGSPWPAAGPVRNGDMVKAAALFAQYGHDVRVFAFPLRASKGTVDCMVKAKRAGLDVVVVLS